MSWKHLYGNMATLLVGGAIESFLLRDRTPKLAKPVLWRKELISPFRNEALSAHQKCPRLRAKKEGRNAAQHEFEIGARKKIWFGDGYRPISLSYPHFHPVAK
jgi:hypothetical protein